jgi:hypothetical protein
MSTKGPKGGTYAVWALALGCSLCARPGALHADEVPITNIRSEVLHESNVLEANQTPNVRRVHH